MSDYRIVCVERDDHEHGHITKAATGSTSNQGDKGWTVAQVRSEIRSGTRFYTDDDAGHVADVEAVTCCGVDTIRSHEDAVKANNLDNLRACRWKS